MKIFKKHLLVVKGEHVHAACSSWYIFGLTVDASQVTCKRCLAKPAARTAMETNCNMVKSQYGVCPHQDGVPHA